MVTLTMMNNLSNIEGLDKKSKQLVTKLLTMHERAGFAKKEVALYKSLSDTSLNTYTGLLPRVLNLLHKHGIKFTVVDRREVPIRNGNFSVIKPFEARDYQKKIIDNLRTRDVICACTGAGKTFMMASAIEKFNVRPVLVLAPDVTLARQNANEIGKFLNVEVGVCCGSEKTIRDITVCTPQSVPDIVRREAKMILIDECHCIPANTVANAIFGNGNKGCYNAYYRIGVSASPWRDDGKDLLIEAATSIRRPEQYLKASDLIRIGKLTPCNIEFLKVDNVFEMQDYTCYNDFYNAAVVNNSLRNKMITDKALLHYFRGDSVLILIKNIKHGELLKKEIQKYTESVVFLSGKDSPKEREKQLELVRKGEIKILIGSTIADVGLDVPILNVLILASGGKSSIKAFQRVGRVLRLYPGKTQATVYDFDDQSPTLQQHTKIRKKLYSLEEEFKIEEA